MGLISSKGVRRRHHAGKAGEQDEMGQSVLSALQVARQTPGRLHDLPFDKLLLKFPTMRTGFEKLHKAFHSSTSLKPSSPGGITGVGGPTGVELIRMKPACEGTISPEEAWQALDGLGLAASQQQLDEAFAALQEKRERNELELTFTDFMLALCVLLLRTGAEDAKARGGDPAAVEALQLAVDSFCHFDKSGTGTLHREEVLATLAEVDQPAHAPSRGRKGVLQERWQQMDWDHDGRVDLRGYLTTLHSWVMEDVEEDPS